MTGCIDGRGYSQIAWSKSFNETLLPEPMTMRSEGSPVRLLANVPNGECFMTHPAYSQVNSAALSVSFAGTEVRHDQAYYADHPDHETRDLDTQHLGGYREVAVP